MSHTPEMMTLVVNTRCNQRCVYCPPMGEAYAGDSGEARLSEIWAAARAALGQGITTFRVSGGEPLLHSQFGGIIQIMRLLREHGATVYLNTNAVSLHHYLDELRGGAVSSLRISLDSTDPVQYQQITQTRVHTTVINNILAAREAGIAVDLIMVLFRHNLDHVLPMVEFCIENDLNLKISDLEPHDFDQQRFFERQYISPDKATELIKAHYPNHRKQPVLAPAGIQMWDILIGGTRIRIKDTNSKKCFSDFCRTQCALYPCPEGVYSFLLKPTGKLTWCKRNAALGVDVLGSAPETLIQTCSNSLQNVRKVRASTGLVSADTSIPAPFYFKGLQPSFGRDRLAGRER
ncbi:MAG TPA: radical SAM protein, partial [Mizugakiibacter sp.]|nr:radical SAM protein [Mizugakiibacter sp.]